jgi:raffinose/stachyose/melibiose transport system substrate-binding protein
MLRKRFWAVACATAMVATMTTGLSVNVFAADDTKDFQILNMQKKPSR